MIGPPVQVFTTDITPGPRSLPSQDLRVSGSQVLRSHLELLENEYLVVNLLGGMKETMVWARKLGCIPVGQLPPHQWVSFRDVVLSISSRAQCQSPTTYFIDPILGIMTTQPSLACLRPHGLTDRRWSCRSQTQKIAL